MKEHETQIGRRIAGGLTVLLTAAALTANAKLATQDLPDRTVAVRAVNYNEAKVPAYTLEDPLRFQDGTPVTRENWPARRREILEIFAHEMYGVEPPPPECVVTELVNSRNTVSSGFALRRQYRMWFKPDRSGPCITWIVWTPRAAKAPSPVILFLNYRGNHELVCDRDIPVQQGWVRTGEFTKNNRAQEATRGQMQDCNDDSPFPLDILIARGYAVMSACYAEVSPDPCGKDTRKFPQETFALQEGVFRLWGPRDPKRTDNTTSLGAWAWALSRGLDLAERIPEIDAKKSVVTGYSRLAKAALLAAARDERFAVCVPNQTGGGGVPLAKRDFGENVSTVNRSFRHWYCPAYAKYAAAPHKSLTFDQHLILAAIAPRALLIEGFNDRWFDTKGEYLAAKAASPAWRLFGDRGLPEGSWPADFETSAIGTRLGYVRRSGPHGITAYDWLWMMDFADGVWAASRN